MINITKNINKTLRKRRTKGEPLGGREIACAFATVIIRSEAMLGLTLDTQAELSKSLNLPVSALHAAYTILRKDYKIIEGWQGSGTRVIREIKPEHHKSISKLIKEHSLPVENLSFDRDYLQKLDTSKEKDILQALTVYEKMSSTEQNLRVLPSLTSALATVMSQKMRYDFVDKEILYTNDHAELITYCCEIFCPKKSHILMLGTACNMVADAIGRSRRRISFLSGDCSGETDTDLETLFQNPKQAIGIIYIGSSAPYPLLKQHDNSFWKRLLKLQIVHQFRIIVDDRLPFLVEMPNLFKDLKRSSNHGLISINAVSLHHKLSEIRVVAASDADIRKLKHSYRSKGMMLHPSLSYGLLKLIQTQKMDHYEPNAYKVIEGVVEAAKQYLLSTDRFVKDYIVNQQAYYFYLELKTAAFPPNLQKKLRKLKISIPVTRNRCLGADFNKGIVISVAAYSKGKTVVEALKILMRYLKS